MLKDAIAEYREKEKSIERIAKKLDKEPDTLEKCKSYIKAAQDVLQDTSDNVGLLDTCQQEFLEDFDIAMVSPGNFNNLKKNTNFSDIVSVFLAVFSVQTKSLVKTVKTLERVQDAEKDPVPKAQSAKKRRTI